jgi:hypothetical protein
MVMGAPKNNQFWKARSKHGRGKIFSTPEILWQAACEYFKWVEENPLKKTIVYQGAVSEETESLMRAMTIEGLCIFLDVPTQTFLNYCDKENDSYKDFFEITTRIREIIRTQKFEGASAGMLNPNIIARDLGLVDKKEVDKSATIKYVNVSKQFPDE